MKKTVRIVLAALVLLSALSGCQKTPQEEIVVGKNLEQLIEKATANGEAQTDLLRERLHVPETLLTSITGHDGELAVNVHAKVTVPEVNGISVVRVKKHAFTQEEADQMRAVFLQGAMLYERDDALAKAEIEAKLVIYYAMRDGAIPIDVDGENPNDTEKLAQIIAHYEKLLLTAPEKKAPIPADTSFHVPRTVLDPDARVIEGTATVHEKPAYLYINNGFFGANNIEACFVNAQMLPAGDFRYAPYTVLNAEDAAKVQPPAAFTMTEAQARTVADKVLMQLGMNEMACVGTSFAVMTNGGPGGNTAAAPEPGRESTLCAERLADGKWAYSLQYWRMVGDVLITPTSHRGNSVSDEENYARPWPYERVELIVDETGIVYFYRVSPYSIAETVTENAVLLDFPKIVSIFEKMFPIAYEYMSGVGTDFSLQVEITEVRLGLMRVTEQNSRDSGLLIPVWDFFGKRTVAPYGSEPYSSDGADSLFTINAVDGSIVDRNLGY